MALGGGTCFNGGWYPPGMPLPGTPAAPPPAPTPTAPPPAGGGTCATPDPFVALGGGTCFNSGWYPPGMPLPGTPAAPPTMPGCIGPDPFVGIPGLIGLCVNGGWLPIVIGGEQSLLYLPALEGGGWPVVADTGQSFAPLNLLE